MTIKEISFTLLYLKSDWKYSTELIVKLYFKNHRFALKVIENIY